MLSRFAKFKRKCLGAYGRLEEAVSGYVFDRRQGIETRKTLSRFELDVEADTRAQAWSYEPCSFPRFKRVMRMLPASPAELTFVDIGSGKGRQLIAAAMLGFPRAIGVEVSPRLHAAAQQNIAAYALQHGSSAEMSVLNQDATRFQVPTEPCVLFLFNPFQEALIRKFIAGLVLQTVGRRAPLYVAYVHPTVREAFDAAPIFQEIATRDRPTDAVVYRFQSPDD